MWGALGIEKGAQDMCVCVYACVCLYMNGMLGEKGLGSSKIQRIEESYK